MERTIDISKTDLLNVWIKKSIEIFENSNYLDRIMDIYTFQITTPARLESDVRRRILMAHQARDTESLLKLLIEIKRFPYDDPVWFLLKNIQGCLANNPKQV